MVRRNRYTTVKMVRVHDMRLGAMHYVFTLTIALYIVVGVMLVDKEYLLVTPPEGTVRVGLLPPGVCADESGTNCEGFQREADVLPYCLQYDGPTVPGLLMPNPFQCRYVDENFAIWPPVEQRGVFATTRVTETQETLPTGCGVEGPDGPLPTTDCYNWDVISSTTYYLSQVEDFTAFIDHTMTASALGLSYSCTPHSPSLYLAVANLAPALNLQRQHNCGANPRFSKILSVGPSENLVCDGLFNADGEKLDPCDDYSAGTCPGVVQLETGTRNILPIKTLLRAAGINNLDTFGDVECFNTTVSPGCESARYSGLVLQVNIEYNNNRDVFNFNTDRVRFRYSVDHVKESEFKAYEIVAGEVGIFDVQTLLVNLVVALGLLGAATTMVDLMMLYILPQKEKYEDAKNEEVKLMDDGTLQKEDAGHPVAITSDEGLDSSLLNQSH